MCQALCWDERCARTRGGVKPANWRWRCTRTHMSGKRDPSTPRRTGNACPRWRLRPVWPFSPLAEGWHQDSGDTQSGVCRGLFASRRRLRVRGWLGSGRQLKRAICSPHRSAEGVGGRRVPHPLPRTGARDRLRRDRGVARTQQRRVRSAPRQRVPPVVRGHGAFCAGGAAPRCEWGR